MDRPQPFRDNRQETSGCCSKTFTASYDEVNAVWCGNQVQAWPWDVSCRYTFQSILATRTLPRKGRSRSREGPFCEFLINIWATIQEIREETAKDPVLQTLKATILNGWPSQRKKLPPELHEYFKVRDELATQDGIIFKGPKCVIPKSLRPKIKEKLHRSHIGVQGCLRRAREVVYWPNMNREVTEFISKCETCNTFQSAQQKQPLICHETRQHPWEKIGCDIFTFNNQDYLCTVDYFSDYFEIDELHTSKTGATVIGKLKKRFATHGIPDTFHSDNGPPFSSNEFSAFAVMYEFEHVTSSPEYPQSKGKVENAVKTAKNLMKKSASTSSDFHLALLDWRNTQTEGMKSSPAQRMFGRRTRTLLPTSKKLLKPQLVTVSGENSAGRPTALKATRARTTSYLSSPISQVS